MKLAQPRGIAGIGLALGHVLGVPRVDQSDIKSALLQNLVGRDPIDPVDSIATLVTPHALNQSAKSCRSCVNVPNARTGVSVQAGSTAAMCIFDPMSMAAALALTGFNSGRSPVVLLGIANPPFNHEQEGLGFANRHFPNRDRRRSGVTTLKSACTHGPRFLTGILPPI